LNFNGPFESSEVNCSYLKINGVPIKEKKNKPTTRSKTHSRTLNLGGKNIKRAKDGNFEVQVK